MTRFEAVRAIYGVDEFSRLIVPVVRENDTPEKLAEFLSHELPEEKQQSIRTMAQGGNYPISFLEHQESMEKEQDPLEEYLQWSVKGWDSVQKMRNDPMKKERELLEEYLHMEYDRLDQCSEDTEHSTPKTGCESEWNDINEKIGHILKILKLVNTETHALDGASRKGAAAVAEGLLNQSASAYVYGDADSTEVRIIDEIHRNLIATFKVRIASHFLMFEEYQFF